VDHGSVFNFSIQAGLRVQVLISLKQFVYVVLKSLPKQLSRKGPGALLNVTRPFSGHTASTKQSCCDDLVNIF